MNTLYPNRNLVASGSAASSTSLRSTLVLYEQLYDQLGRPAFKTATVAMQNNPAILGFYSNFITTENRDPIKGGTIWQGGAIAGDITQLVDKTSFTSPEDPGYAYQGTYYEPAPTSRVIKKSGLGAAFNKSSDHSTNYYDQEFPITGTPIANDLDDLIHQTFNISAPTLYPSYKLATKRSSLGQIGDATTISLKQFNGLPIVNGKCDNNKYPLLTGYSYKPGATKSGDQQTPIMFSARTLLPNYYNANLYPNPQDTAKVQNTERFYLTTQTNTLGQTVYQDMPDTGQTVNFYDNYGRLRFSQNADQKTYGIVIYYLYDQLSRPTEVGYFTGTWQVSTFVNSTLQPDASIFSLSGTTPVPLRQMQYDLSESGLSTNNFNKLVQINSWNTQVINNTLSRVDQAIFSEKYAYDALGRVIQLTKLVINEDLVHIFYSYDALNRLLYLIYPQGGQVNYTYNIQGQVEKVFSNGELIASYYYNARNKVVKETMGNDLITRRYVYGNPLEQLTSISDDKGLFQESLAYTNTNGAYQDGNIQTIRCKFGTAVNATFPEYQINFKYDAFGRLLEDQWQQNNTSWMYAQYRYDANGNLQSMNKNTPSVYRYIAGTNKLEQLTSPTSVTKYGYTNQGLVNYMITVSNGVSTDLGLYYHPLFNLPSNLSNPHFQFAYDKTGEVYVRGNALHSIRYYRGLDSKILNETIDRYDIKTYIYGPLGLIYIIDKLDAKGYFVLKDHLGSTRVVYDRQNISAYYTYDSWGNIVDSGGVLSNPADLVRGVRYLYTGQEFYADLQLYNYHARLYNPAVGRFLAPDPARESASPYSYVGNNPINFTDPTGKVRLPELESKLATGPIFIGEEHNHPFARQAIHTLIDTGKVKRIFLEIPNAKGELDEILKNPAILDSVDIMARRKINSSPLSSVVKAALQKDISVYIHDMPTNPEGKYIDDKGNIVVYNQTPKGELKVRNNYSKDIIKNNRGQEPGTIILAGQNHLDPVEVEDGATLQSLLGYKDINDVRHFDLTNPLEP